MVDYLCIGHVCHDIVGDDTILGGTASYASLVASKLGRKTALITSYGPDFKFEDRFGQRGISCVHQKSTVTTIFENIYSLEGRMQYMHQRATSIPYSAIPSQWRNTDIIHLCLIADELEQNFITELVSNKSESQVIGLAIQGALRHVEKNRQVVPKSIDPKKYEGVTVALMSDDDISHDPSIVYSLSETIPVVIVTHGARGATAYLKKGKKFYPSFATTEVDPTGAGDVFGTAFLIAYTEEKNIQKAMIFAHSAASISVEGRGTSSIPTLESVNKRASSY